MLYIETKEPTEDHPHPLTWGHNHPHDESRVVYQTDNTIVLVDMAHYLMAKQGWISSGWGWTTEAELWSVYETHTDPTFRSAAQYSLIALALIREAAECPNLPELYKTIDCGADPALRHEVWAMVLAEHETANG